MNQQQMQIARDYQLLVTCPDDDGNQMMGNIEQLCYKDGEVTDVYVRTVNEDIRLTHLLRYPDGESIELVPAPEEAKAGKFLRMGPHKEAKHECILPITGFTKKTIWECPCGQQWIATREPDSGWRVKWRKKWWRVQILKTWKEPSKPVGKVYMVWTDRDGVYAEASITDPDVWAKISKDDVEHLSIGLDDGEY